MQTAVSRLIAVFQIRPSETNLVTLVTGLMFFASAGGAIGSPGIEALFIARFGVEFFPAMYIMLGLVTILTSLLMTAVLARVRQDRFLLLLPLVLASLLIGARLLLSFDPVWFYPILWLGMNLFWLIQTLFVWGLASLVCDTRQAKRLFPLFGVGGIIGLTGGSFLTRPLVSFIGVENLIIMWAVGLILAFGLALKLLQTSQLQLPPDFGWRQKPHLVAEIRAGFRIVSQSALLKWIAAAAVLFAVLYYALVFPFATAVSLEFSNENEMAVFLGTFQGIAFGLAVLASLFLANRLYARFGFMATILIYPIIYLLGFSIVAVSVSFTAIVIFRFFQVFWSAGLFDGASQGMYNVVPASQREKARTFIQGIANQLGISLAGVMLLFGNRFLETEHLFIIGGAAAALTVFFVWQARRAYGSAVVSALKMGQSHIFYSEEEPFGGFQQDATAVATAIAGIHHPDVSVRRIAADILGNLSVPEGTEAIVKALDDEDPSVRAALLRALAQTKETAALLEVSAYLHDEEAEVRLQAVKTLSSLTTYPRGLKNQLEPLLDDPDTAVRSRAAVGLLNFGPHERAATMLTKMATIRCSCDDDITDRLLAMEALVDWGGQAAYDAAAMGLNDETPAIRRVAARIMAKIDAEQCLFPLRAALGDEDESVRQAAAEALGHVGEPALAMTVSALKKPNLERGALLALRYLPAWQAAADINHYSQEQVIQAQHYHNLWGLFQQERYRNKNNEPLAVANLLADSLKEKATYHGRNALQAMGLIRYTQAINLAISNLTSQDSNQRANAMETLDTLGDSAIVRPLLPIWEPGTLKPAPMADWLLVVLQDEDAWLRASAAVATKSIPHNGVVAAQLAEMAQSDPEPLVRESVLLTLNGAKHMDTIPTLSTMERILFLREVPLFAELPLNDLKQIAASAGEQQFGDGTIIAKQGEQGEIMFIIVAGEVAVSVKKESGVFSELGHRGPGEYVGEMAIISNEERMASLTAVGDVRTLYITQSQFKEILWQRPETSLAVMQVLCQRLREHIQ